MEYSISSSTKKNFRAWDKEKEKKTPLQVEQFLATFHSILFVSEENLLSVQVIIKMKEIWSELIKTKSMKLKVRERNIIDIIQYLEKYIFPEMFQFSHFSMNFKKIQIIRK
jgi:hypothetical protein